MRRVFILFLFCFLTSVVPTWSAFADANRILTNGEAKRFVDSLDPALVFSKRMESEGKSEYTSVIKKHLKGDDYNVYTQNMIHFKEIYPEEYAAFTVIVKQFKFSNSEEWASVGDAVMLAFLAGQEDMNKISEDMEQNITPAILASMQPELREQTQAAMDMIKAIKNVPKQNIETVKPYGDKIAEYTKDLK